jgi:hypothetical protein
MNQTGKIKIIADISMTIALLCLMSYELIGQVTHEITGIVMLILFVMHHILNRRWFSAIRKGTYRPYRIFQTLLVLFLVVLMISQGCSGIILSKHLFRTLPFHQGYGLARTIHMLGGYWGFIFMSLHLGLHWNIIVTQASKAFAPSVRWGKILRIVSVLIAAYGAVVLLKREIILYLTLQNPFVYFNFDEPLLYFFFDYIMAMGLFVFLGYHLGKHLPRK